MVGEVWDAHGWNLSFRRHLDDWEIDNLAEFYNTLNLFKGPSLRKTILHGKWINKGDFQSSQLTENSTILTTRLIVGQGN